MKAASLNLDSFVDIVACSVGVLIIVALLPIILAGETSISLDKDRRAYRQSVQDAGRQARQLANFVSETAEAKAALEEIREKHAAPLEALESAEASHRSALEKLDQAKKRLAEARSRLEELGTEEAGARAKLAGAEREIAKKIAGLDSSPAGRTLVRRARLGKLEELRTSLDGIEKAAAALKAEADGLKSAMADLRKEMKTLEEKKEATAKEIADLMARSFITVEVRDPLARVEREQKPVWMECYLPGKSVDPDGEKRPCVRFVNLANYKREGAALRPLKEGESILRLLDADSAFGAYLARGKADFKDKHYLYFVVRPDAYAAFRLARKLAWGGGWKVGWDPLEPGDTLSIGVAGAR